MAFTVLSRQTQLAMAEAEAAWDRLILARALLTLARHGGRLWSQPGRDGRRVPLTVRRVEDAAKLAELEAYVAERNRGV